MGYSFLTTIERVFIVIIYNISLLNNGDRDRNESVDQLTTNFITLREFNL